MMHKEQRVDDGKIGVMSKAFGPDFDLLGRSRHQDALSAIFRKLPRTTYSQHVHEVVFVLIVGGRFERNIFKKPITTGHRRTSVSRDRTLFIDIGIASSDLLLSETDFRETFVSALEQSAQRAVQYLDKNKIAFEKDAFLDHVRQAISAYKQLQLPLPATKSEVDLARFFGVE